MNSLYDKTITDLVKRNYVYASVLYYFGIEFYNYSQNTLQEVCQAKGLDIKSVINRLESLPVCQDDVALEVFPIDLIIEYLKHTHFIFIKQRLPYLGKIIADLPESYCQSDSLIKDLKFVFPLFVEDFIHHIYEEEDTLFKYISRLQGFYKEGGNLSALYFEMEQNNLSAFAHDHEAHDDEMLGIRQITHDYRTVATTPLHIKVIFEELKLLENELKTHARVENDILFPKALELERTVVEKIKVKAMLN